ncbi:site-specific integrase [Enterococcus casseliflavus]|uniref:tyrosine-type recombinase/integrase n=1 Tax=Enterococcus casseliflavus TaxID=37734 RepID=UPI003D4E4C82
MVKNKTTSGDGIYPYYLKNGKLRYEAYAFNGVDKGTGKQSKKHKKGFHTYADAKKWKKVTEGEFADEEYIHHNLSRLKIKDYLNEWLNVYKPNLKLGAKINYRQTIDFYVIPYIGNYVLSEYNTRTHQKYINSLMCDKNIGKDNNGLSLGSVKKVHDLISSAFNQAVALGILKNNPAKGVSFPKKKQDDTLHYFTYQETEIFLEEARNQKDPAWYPIFLTIFDQGLRKGETLGLEWKDIDFNKNIMHIRRTRVFAAENKKKWTYVVDDPKTISSIRDLPMTNRMKQALLSYRNYVIGIFGHLPYTGENQFIFIKTAYNNEIGTPFRGQAINPAMNRIIESQDLPKIKVHDGRHTYAVRLREAGVSLDDIGELLGHTDAKTTRIYAHITPEIKERAVDKLETYLISKQNASVH